MCAERSLVVELQAQADAHERQQQRAAFLGGLGYTVLRVCPRELQRQPRAGATTGAGRAAAPGR